VWLLLCCSSLLLALVASGAAVHQQAVCASGHQRQEGLRIPDISAIALKNACWCLNGVLQPQAGLLLLFCLTHETAA
jgi:hypothetical protein